MKLNQGETRDVKCVTFFYSEKGWHPRSTISCSAKDYTSVPFFTSFSLRITSIFYCFTSNVKYLAAHASRQPPPPDGIDIHTCSHIAIKVGTDLDDILASKLGFASKKRAFWLVACSGAAFWSRSLTAHRCAILASLSKYHLYGFQREHLVMLTPRIYEKSTHISA